MALKYKFDIPYKTFNEYLIGDKIKEDAAKNAHTFAGTSFLEPLLVKMNDIESDTIELQVDKSRIYFTSKKAPNFITINAHCKMCPVKYTLRVKKMPDENVDFEFEIEKTEQHNQVSHESKKVVVKGDKREELAKSILLNSGGSAKAYHDAQVGQNLAKVPSQDVMKKIVSDFMKNEMVSTNWITNILHQLKFVYPENV